MAGDFEFKTGRTNVFQGPCTPTVTLSFEDATLSLLTSRTYVNFMDWYQLSHKAETWPQFSSVNQRLSRSEFRPVLAYADEAGLWPLDVRQACGR